MSTRAATGAGASFRSDNDWGASPEILAAMSACNEGPARPYGADEWTRRVEERFAQVFERPVGVLLVATGTAANSLSLAAVTPPWGSVLCHRNAHINTDECGAPEFYTSAKLICSASGGSKLDPRLLEAEMAWGRGDVHSAQVACVSITQATEDGQAYSAAEITRIGALCRAASVRLHMDGARFANALVAMGGAPADLTWRAGVDLLSFGASKNGALNAEAIVVFDETLMAKLPYLRKRAGHLASKMRFPAAQMLAYLEQDLWLVNARRANVMARRLAEGLAAVRGAELEVPALTNILFMRMSEELSSGLQQRGYDFYRDRWGPGVVRLVTSFRTTPEMVDGMVAAAREIAGARG
jgi:threonine aldolase